MAIDLNGKKLPKGIHQRANGLYVGRFKYHNHPYVFYDRDLDRLQRTLEDKKYEAHHDLLMREENITMDLWFETWMREFKTDLKANTVHTYTQVYKLYIQPEFGGRRLKDIRSETIQTFINKLLREGKSRSRVNIAYVILLGMYKKAIILNKVKNNPLNAVEFPKNKAKKEMRVMSIDEQNIFLQYARNHNYYDVYLMALCTGMRIGEILALRWSDVDFSTGLISVNGTLVYIGQNKRRFIDTPKSMSSQRQIPMLDRIITMLHQRREKQLEWKQLYKDTWSEAPGMENLVFTYKNGGAYWDSSIRNELYKIIRSINKDGIPFEHITPHTFRHTFATRGLENNIPPKVMQSILGHSSLAITMDKYSHVLPDMKAKEMEKINNIF